MFDLPCHFSALEFPAAALDLAEVLVRLFACSVGLLGCCDGHEEADASFSV